MEKVVALDIGGVCINLRHPEAFVYFGLDPRQTLPPEFLYAVDRLEKGEIGEEEWLRQFQAITGGRFTPEELVHGWNIIVGPAIEGMPELLAELTEKGFRLVFFSDTSKLHIDKMYHDAEFTHLVTGAVFSYEVGAKKPEAGMYEAFERDYGRPAFYIDDKPENIAAGTQRGWPSHRFTGVEPLRRALTAEFGDLFPEQQ